jgi:H+/Cl- antiporter ClcA
MNHQLADFTATRRLIPISVVAIVIGLIGALAASALLDLIALSTNLFFYQRFSTAPVGPAGNHMGVFAVAVPVIGGLLIGVLARFGSERIRGHGIPEALEAILTRGSRIEPKVALLKPISAAISIGSGGPFGAEGPIIMTAGAFGSMIAQVFHLTSAERKTLLVAGAAAGMSATFAAPLAATLLAVELLLFELKPRSLVPVALASGTAALVRHVLLGNGPLFPVHAHAFTAPGLIAGAELIGGCVVVGLLAGVTAALMTASVYVAEDAFKRLPWHWAWWPALGGIAVGIGGLICPSALGVGYDVIADTLAGHALWRDVLLLVVVKWTIWAISLGSGTSGGVLAPLLMIGASVGSLAAGFLPAAGVDFWPAVAMGAILGGTMRAPLTGVVFAVELTGDFDLALPLLVAAATAHAFTVLVLKRSILTEKVARRGFHVTREYAIDPLEILCVRDVLEPGVVEVVADDIQVRANDPLGDVLRRMATSGRTRMVVIGEEGEDDGDAVLGAITLEHLLEGQRRHIEEETRRERVIRTSGLVPPLLRPSWDRLTSLSARGERSAPP